MYFKEGEAETTGIISSGFKTGLILLAVLILLLGVFPSLVLNSFYF